MHMVVCDFVHVLIKQQKIRNSPGLISGLFILKLHFAIHDFCSIFALK